MIWLFAAPLVSRTVKVVATFVGGLVILMMIGAPLLGLFLQPFAPFWFGQGNGVYSVGSPGAVTVPIVSEPISIPTAGGVSDAQRYLLAIGAGFSATEAIIATAISIAEDGSGNPAAMSAPNFDNSRDYCLMQINSGWWDRVGRQQALADPQTCFRAARYVFERQGWCAWSTYEASCGAGHNGAYGAFMTRARAAAQHPIPEGQA